MARLAAYYQEEFHYAPTGYGSSKQRKAAYIAYGDEPRNNLFNGGYLGNRHRMSNLTMSDPALSPPYSPSVAGTIRGNPYYGQQMVRNPQNVDYYIDPREHYQDQYLDNESMYGGRCAYDDRYAVRLRPDKVRKRLVYDDTWNDSRGYGSPIPVSMDRYHPHYQNGNNFDDNRDVYNPNAAYRSDSSHGRWQQWPWATEETYLNPSLLSPPSPLDSGLSSQSITSSPSLEAETFPAHLDPVLLSRPNKNGCLCYRNVYSDYAHHMRVDTGRTSPCAMSTKSRMKAMVHANNRVNCSHDFRYVESSPRAIQSPEQIRYGKLGLLSDPDSNNSQALTTIPKCPKGNSPSKPNQFERSKSPFVYNYVDENGVAFMKPPPSKLAEEDRKSSKSQAESTSDKESSKKQSPEPEHSDKSPEPESSVSLAVSNCNSNSSSVSSSNNDLMDPKKSSKTTEKGIRELEDMYKKCNLGDRDLMDRAERRDLPTAHQIRVDHAGSPNALTRSKSDTFYEMLSATYHNPYQRPPRAPPSRRSGIPDRVADDMALRKLRKNSITSIPRPNDNPVTYMLCSSHFTPTISSSRDILFMDKPDVEHDDFSYRTHYVGRKDTLNEIQPPFGIPLRPPPAQRVFTDYLHAMPNGGLQNLCHPRRNPDTVRDDMAFRTLRKDEPCFDTASMYRKVR